MKTFLPSRLQVLAFSSRLRSNDRLSPSKPQIISFVPHLSCGSSFLGLAANSFSLYLSRLRSAFRNSLTGLTSLLHWRGRTRSCGQLAVAVLDQEQHVENREESWSGFHFVRSSFFWGPMLVGKMYPPPASPHH